MKLTLNAIRGLPLLNLIVIMTVIFSMFVFDTTSAAKKARRCFNCRSRGELGDCRDPFYLSANSTLVKNSKKGKCSNNIFDEPITFEFYKYLYTTLAI